jgi:hypothetical protein
MHKIALWLTAMLTSFSLSLLAQVKQRPVQSSGSTIRTDSQNATAATSTNDLLTETRAMFDKMEATIEVEFAKLKKETQEQIETLKNKTKQVDAQVQSLNRQIKKLEAVLNSIERLMPQFIANRDSIRRTPGGGMLNGDLRRIDDRIDSLMGKRTEAADQLLQLNGQVNLKLQEKTAIQQLTAPQVSKLEAHLLELDKQKAKMIADLRKQRDKTLEEIVNQQEQQSKLQLEELQRQVNTKLQDSIKNIRLRQVRIQ